MSDHKFADTKFTRRGFLGAAGAALGATAVGSSILTGLHFAAADEEMTGDRVCAVAHMGHCQGNCSLKVTVRDGRIALIEPNNWNGDTEETCCVKGISEVQHVYSPERIQTPLRRIGERGEGKFEAISWDEALDEVVSQLKKCNETHGPGSILVDAAGELYERSSIYPNLESLLNATGINFGGVDLGISNGYFPGINFAFGCSTCETNWKTCDLVMLVGTNPVESNLTTNRYFMDAKQGGTKFICVDPNFSRTASKSDVWLPIKPGYDAELLLAMTKHILDNKLYDTDYMLLHTDMPFLVNTKTGERLRDHEPLMVEGEWGPELEGGDTDPFFVLDAKTGKAVPYGTEGVEPVLDGEVAIDGDAYRTVFSLTLDHYADYTPEWAAKRCDISQDRIREVAEMFAKAPVKSLIFGFGGPDKMTNSDVLGHAGLVLASLTGVVGGTSGAGFGMDDASYNRSFELGSWRVEPTAELPEPSLDHYDIRDPENNVHAVFSGGDGFMQHHADMNKTIEWVKGLDFVCMVDIYHQTFVDYADIVLPACSKFESEEDFVNIRGQRERVLLSERAIEPLFDSHSDFWIIREIFKRMGAEDKFPTSIREMLEHSLATCEFPGVSNITIGQLLDNHGIVRVIDDPNYPLQVQDYQFPTASSRVETYFQDYRDLGQSLPTAEEPSEIYTDNPLRESYPMMFMQVRTQFHLHSQYADASWIRQFFEPRVEISPEDAEARGIQSGDTVRIFNDRGELKTTCEVNNSVLPGVVKGYEGWWSKDYFEGNSQMLTNPDRELRGGLLPLGPVIPFFDTLVEIEKA